MFDLERQNMKDTAAFYAEQKRKDALHRERCTQACDPEDEDEDEEYD